VFNFELFFLISEISYYQDIMSSNYIIMTNYNKKNFKQKSQGNTVNKVVYIGRPKESWCQYFLNVGGYQYVGLFDSHNWNSIKNSHP
jgi:hypothetical protein